MKRLDLALAMTSLELGGAPARPPGGENGNAPIPRLEGLGKGVEIVAQSKVKLLVCSIGK